MHMKCCIVIFLMLSASTTHSQTEADRQKKIAEYLKREAAGLKLATPTPTTVSIDSTTTNTASEEVIKFHDTSLRQAINNRDPEALIDRIGKARKAKCNALADQFEQAGFVKWANDLIIYRRHEAAERARIAALTPTPAPTPTPKPTPGKDETYAISALDLVYSYSENEVAADSDFKNRWAIVSGTVERVGRDLRDDPYVRLQSPRGEFRSVQAFVDREKESQLLKLSNGDKISLYGQCVGLFGNVLFKSCILVPYAEPGSIIKIPQ